ncbi:MAG: hypothetical protein FWC22_05305 [Treponema sp.]|nr:hypothetical protein [Treponema sp.]
MEIKINEKTLDINLENENTLGDVLAGIEQWLSSSGHRIAELNIDGQTVNASMIEEIFSRDIKNIKCININTTVIAELTAASLINLLEDIGVFETLSFDEKKKYYDTWKETPTAMYISSEIPDLYAYCFNTFSSGEISVNTLKTIAEEIQREVNFPADEIIKIESILNEICVRLVDLPLDIQTGKDARAAQTIQIFSAVTEKLFRIFNQLDIQGYFTSDKPESKEQIKERKEQLNKKFSDFSGVIKELFDAYERNDSVLVGDITEYEVSPKLKELYIEIMNNVQDKSLMQKKAQGDK